MEYLLWIMIFLIGAALGSFIAVVAGRYNTGLSFWSGRSFCFACNSALQTRDLFPILSFLWLRGKCRDCGSRIPAETIFIEIIMGFLTVLAFIKFPISNFQFSLNFQFPIFILTTLIFGIILLISIYDLKHFIIPDSFLVLFLIFSLIFNFQFGIFNKFSIFNFIISGVGLTLPFLVIFLISRGRWMGFGDVKYIFVIGVFLGLVQGLSAVVLAFWIGAAFALLALTLRRALPIFRNNFTIKSEIPFGPFLSLGTIASFLLALDLFHFQSFFGL